MLEKRGVGNPGKSGTLEDLIVDMLDGVSSDVLRVMYDNLELKVLTRENLLKLSRKFKLVDIHSIEKIRDYLATRLIPGTDNEEDKESTRPEGWQPVGSSPEGPGTLQSATEAVPPAG